ncbi:polyprenyl synthetase family protein [Dendrosporobacter sp. 1207_IL3150]|uniref:polyprenyl synthetase family protein n=1 Tax=Dendrosporobacter sp. 1207_IL3150 TaxID=3084054 RepID=UPI002FD986C8
MIKNSIFGIVQNDLTALEAELLSVIHSPVHLIKEISEHLVKAGGKRLRPALYFLSARSAGNVDNIKLQPLATAIELIHMATLVHDDVIDNASTRRGIPTANTKWGNQMSVLIGDYLFAKAFSIVASNQVSSRVMEVLTEVICSMSEGEIIQNQDTFNADQGEMEYLGRIAKKTADFIAASCELGALTGGLSSEDVQALRDYGYSIGMAFQITDDILDMTASSEQLGKPAGNDLRQGIVTLPIIYALQNSADAEELRNIVITRNMSEEKLARGLEIIHSTDAIDYSYRMVDEYLTRARTVLPVALPSEIREAFLAVTEFIEMRNF